MGMSDPIASWTTKQSSGSTAAPWQAPATLPRVPPPCSDWNLPFNNTWNPTPPTANPVPCAARAT